MYVSPNRENTLTGLCGPFDGNVADDAAAVHPFEKWRQVFIIIEVIKHISNLANLYRFVKSTIINDQTKRLINDTTQNFKWEFNF